MKACISTLLLVMIVSACFANDFAPVFTPDGAKIDTSEKAMNAVKTDSALSDTESSYTTDFFRVDQSIEGFAKKGDRIWQVHFVNIERYVTKIAWVNAETGGVRFVYPEKK